jgi:hypothetical protein
LLHNYTFSGSNYIYLTNGVEKIQLTTPSSTPFVWGIVQTRVGTDRWCIEGYIGQAYNFALSQTITFSNYSSTSGNDVCIQVPVPWAIVRNFMPLNNGRCFATSTNGTSATAGTDMTLTKHLQAQLMLQQQLEYME